MVLHLDRVVPVVVQTVASDAVLSHVVEALECHLAGAEDDVGDQRDGDDQDRKDQLHALAVSYHLPVAADEALLLLPLYVVLDIVALDGHEVLVHLDHILRRQVLRVVRQDIHRNEEVRRDLDAEPIVRLLASAEHVIHPRLAYGHRTIELEAMPLLEKPVQSDQLLPCALSHL